MNCLFYGLLFSWIAFVMDCLFSLIAFRYRVLISKKRDRTTTGVPRRVPAGFTHSAADPEASSVNSDSV